MIQVSNLAHQPKPHRSFGKKRRGETKDGKGAWLNPPIVNRMGRSSLRTYGRGNETSNTCYCPSLTPSEACPPPFLADPQLPKAPPYLLELHRSIAASTLVVPATCKHRTRRSSGPGCCWSIGSTGCHGDSTLSASLLPGPRTGGSLAASRAWTSRSASRARRKSPSARRRRRWIGTRPARSGRVGRTWAGNSCPLSSSDLGSSVLDTKSILWKIKQIITSRLWRHFRCSVIKKYVFRSNLSRSSEDFSARFGTSSHEHTKGEIIR